MHGGVTTRRLVTPCSALSPKARPRRGSFSRSSARRYSPSHELHGNGAQGMVSTLHALAPGTRGLEQALLARRCRRPSESLAASAPNSTSEGQRCSVPFGKPLRKCVAASLEAHLHATRGMKTLELGYGSRSLAREVVVQSGGSWTGLEPTSGRTPAIGKGGYGHAGHIPFPDATFDLVFGIQSIEHWEEKQPSLPDGLTYAQLPQGDLARAQARGLDLFRCADSSARPRNVRARRSRAHPRLRSTRRSGRTC